MPKNVSEDEVHVLQRMVRRLVLDWTSGLSPNAQASISSYDGEVLGSAVMSLVGGVIDGDFSEDAPFHPTSQERTLLLRLISTRNPGEDGSA